MNIEELLVELRSADWKRRQAAAERLGQLKNPEAVPGLIEALQDNETRVVTTAIEALIRVGTPAVESLVETLEQHDDPSVRYATTIVLGAIGDAAAVPGLTAALDDPSADVRSGANEALQALRAK